MSYQYNHIIQPGAHYELLANMYHTTYDDIVALNPTVNPNYLRIGQSINIPMANFIQQSRQVNNCISQAAVSYKNDMRSLWEEHVAWTRMAIISLTFKLPDIEFVLKRLLQNATDMGNMVTRVYGEITGVRYAELIKEHLLIAADLVKAALAGNEQAAMEVDRKWHQNADQIAEFLSSVESILN